MAFSKGKNRRRGDGDAAQLLRIGRRVGFGVGAAVLVAACGYGAYQWALTSGTFAVKSIHFEGLSRATDGELMKISGLAFGQNLFSLDPAQLERAMAQHPWLISAHVERRFPSSVVVTCVEHQPMAVVALGELYLLDEAGQPFKRVQPQDALDLPLVSGVSRDEYVASPAEASRRFARALDAARAFARMPSTREAKLSEIRTDSTGITLVVGDGLAISLGDDPQTFPDALARLIRVRAELARRGLTARAVYLGNRARPSWVTVSVEPLAAAPRGQPAR